MLTQTFPYTTAVIQVVWRHGFVQYQMVESTRTSAGYMVDMKPGCVYRISEVGKDDRFVHVGDTELYDVNEKDVEALLREGAEHAAKTG